MSFARHGTGPIAAIRAIGSQVHPVFMLPPLAASWFGAILAFEFSPGLALLHSVAIFAAVYTAHVKDGYIDFHVRGEDADHPLTSSGCGTCLGLASTAFAACLLVLWIAVDWRAVALTAPTWVIGYLHAPHLDMHPVGTTFGYPVGVALAILGGYSVQAGALTTTPLAIAAIFVLMLGGIKIVDDEQDLAFDRSMGKRTVPVLFGPRHARLLAASAMLGALTLVIVLTVVGVFPPGAILGVAAFGFVAGFAVRADPSTATALLIRGSYVFLGLLVLAMWFRPLS